jgi:DNA-binding Xre family transcriptional regulator
MIKMDKKELCNTINIKEGNLNKIETRGQLKEKLLSYGYKLKEKVKEGRKVYYILETVEADQQIQATYNNLCRYVYNTNKPNEFGNYFIHRTTPHSILNKKELAEIAEVSDRTISKWDNTLLDKNIISKEGFYYFSIDKHNGVVTQCDEEEYKSFWRNKQYLKAFATLQTRYLEGKITLNELTLASADIGAYMALTEDKYCYRIKRYKKIETELYFSTKDLINKLYDDNEFYPDIQFLLENK